MADAIPGVTTIATFGQTEMSPVTCVLEGADARRKLRSVGRPDSTVAVRIVDDAMRDVEPGNVGRDRHRGPSMMEGYWDDPEATAEAFAGGENIYCAEIEKVLASHPEVSEVAIIGKPHPRWGETAVAVIVPRGDSSPSLSELASWCENRLARYKQPRHVVTVTEMPPNAMGKILQGELRERFAMAADEPTDT